MALEVGSRLGHWNVTALIGEGGMGQVNQGWTLRSWPRRCLRGSPQTHTTTMTASDDDGEEESAG